MMDSGAETLHGAMWFSNTSPSYEQLSPVRPNRCDIVAAPQEVRGIISLSFVRFTLINYTYFITLEIIFETITSFYGVLKKFVYF